MSQKEEIYRVFITGIICMDSDPANGETSAILENMHAVEVQSRLIDDDKSWPMPERKKRQYTCSICGGRHSARWCTKRHKKSTVDPWINESETLINKLSKGGKK